MNAEIAVVILNWNGAEMLRKFLPSVLRYSVGENVEVYVADNASTDNSLPVLTEEFPSVKRIILKKNYGFAEGYNNALKEIWTKYYVLLNSDVEVTEHWLEPLKDYMEEHPEVAACQPKIRSWPSKTFFEYAGACGGFIDKYGYPFCRGRIMSTVEEDRGQYENVISVFWATGAALFIRAEDYWDASGLDGRFFAHMEEIDLCWRLRNSGRKLVCIPQSVVYHVGGGTLQKENPKKTFLNFRNNLLMLYKNLPAQELSQVMFVRFILDMVAAFAFLLKGQFSNAWAVIRARCAYRRMREEFGIDREENLQKSSSVIIPERLRTSILIQYYLKGKKCFSQLSREII